MREGFAAGAIDHIYVLPVLDHRIDGADSAKLNEHREMKRAIKIHVKKRRYPITRLEDLALLGPITRDGLEDSDPAMIARLGPPSARYVLLLVLDDSASTVGLGRSTTVAMTGYLYDKQRGELLWRNRGSYEFEMGGVGGFVMGIGSFGTGLLNATRSVMIGLPKKPKSR